MTRTIQKTSPFAPPFPRLLLLAGFLFFAPTIGGCRERNRQPDPETTASLRREGEALFGGPIQTPLVAPRVLDEGEPAPPSFAESLSERSPSSAGQGAPSGGAGAPIISPAEGWSILISRVPEGSEGDAAGRLERIRTRGGLPDAALQRRGGGLVIAVGSFASPTSPEAKAALARVRATQVNGARPYAYAFFAPPTGEGVAGSNPEWDLRNVRARLGSNAEYTLQVGVYARVGGGVPTPEEVAEFRRAAEQAVASLRADGEQAFYYHGPTSSTITIGAFDASEHDSSVSPPIESRHLRELRKRHPHNLVNGAGFRETATTDSGRSIQRLQRSQLVQIPR